MNKVKVEYVGKDLEAMDLAENYHQWILDEFKPFFGRHLVEVGAGTGSFSKLLLTTRPDSLAVVEPSAMFDVLRAEVATNGGPTIVRHFNDIFCDVAEAIRADQQPDTIIYVNVLEHIDDDTGELAKIFETLKPGGRICIFVPAQRFLFSDFDKHIGHFRRYGKEELEKKCTDAGFKLVLSRNFDFIGIFPWLVKYRWMRSVSMESGMVKLYDKVVVPIERRLEAVIPAPIGKNLLLVAEK